MVVSGTYAGLDKPELPSFDFAHLRDLHTRILVREIPSLSVVRLTLRGPDGQVEYRDTEPYSTDGLLAIELPGMDHPVGVTAAKPMTKGYALERAIPVAGSNLRRFGAAGEWTLEADLNEQRIAAVGITVSREP